MATAGETLQATLSRTAYSTLKVLAESVTALSGRKIAAALGISPTTANGALATLLEAGFVASKKAGRATLWQLVVSNPSISAWLEEIMPAASAPAAGSSPYSTGGGGVRLEHSYAACLVAGLLAGESVAELGDAVSVESIRLQASDVSEVDDILIEGRDAQGDVHRSSIAVRRSPALTKSDSASVPLVRDFLAVVGDHWPELSQGRWRLVLAVSTNANAITQLAELTELARSLPNGEEMASRLSQPGRTNAGLRDRYGHIKSLVEQASEGLSSVSGLSAEDLTWRLLSSLSSRRLRLERNDRADRTTAVNTLQRMLHNGTTAVADGLFSRIEELVGEWAPQAAVLTQSLIRRSLSNYPLSRSARYATAWGVLDRLGNALRDSVKPTLGAGAGQVELERADIASQLRELITTTCGANRCMVVTGEPDVGKSSLALKAVEVLQTNGAVTVQLSLRDLPPTVIEFEALLGSVSIEELLSTAEVGPARLLLIDGAEAVLEGKQRVLQSLATSALKTGLAVIAVTRTDGSAQTQEVLAQAAQRSGADPVPQVFEVPPLTDEERQSLPSHFPTLAHLAGDTRVQWLLGRPGLVEALLRTGEVIAPESALCEADVFSTVWNSLIRNREHREPGKASPDDREGAALVLAGRALGLGAQDRPGSAAAELRSNGVFKPQMNPAFSRGDEFSSDLYRDFAVSKYILTQGWNGLADAGAPRWTIRAARVAAQARLRGGLATEWRALEQEFSLLADTYGERWMDVPYEALLALGDTEAALGEVWTELADDDFAGLKVLLRLAQARFAEGGFGDVHALAGIVSVAYVQGRDIAAAGRIKNKTLGELIRELVLAWLRGMALADGDPNPLRQAVRDRTLESDPPTYDDFAVEALACLGADLDDRVEDWLRKIASHDPHRLNEAVESVAVAIAMSQHNPLLMLELAEAYYIEKPRRNDHWGAGRHIGDDGIRDMHHGSRYGFGPPFAAWYYGPFYRLLMARPRETVAFINRMLDHAAKFRMGILDELGDALGQGTEPRGVEMAVATFGRRTYIGDSHVWGWYRGTTVGPYPCMSALLALEKFADEIKNQLRLPLANVIQILLRDSNNLATLGLVVGFLVRHLDEVDAELDAFLAHPEVWHLETARVVGEHGFRVRDAGADQLTGTERRRITPHEIVGHLVVNARLRGDETRLAQLKSLGERLVANAKASAGDRPVDPEYLAMIESWAAEFDFENYSASKADDGLIIQFERPPELEKVLAPSAHQLQLTNTLYALQSRYAFHNDKPQEWPLDTLSEDIKSARTIIEGESPQQFMSPENPVASVAAAAVRAHALGLSKLEDEDVRWAADVIMHAAENPLIDGMSFEGTMFSMGADRAAAVSVPLLLMPAFDSLTLDRNRIIGCLKGLANSLFDEVRAGLAIGCSELWNVPCAIDARSGQCIRHAAAWSAAIGSLAAAELGPFDFDSQRRVPGDLGQPYHVTLLNVKDDDLLLNRLRMPVSCMVDARDVACVSEQVRELWTPLWKAHERSLKHWWTEDYDHQSHINQAPISRRLVELALSGDWEPLTSHIQSFATVAKPLHQLMESLAEVFTYDESIRNELFDFWPIAMGVALDTVGDGGALREDYWYGYVPASLMPVPRPHSYDPDIDGVLRKCRENWVQPEVLEGLIDRWLPLARWEPKSVDVVTRFARSAPAGWQASTGLEWIEVIMDGRFELFANHLWTFEEWASELRADGAFEGENLSRYHRIVDGLAAAGDHAAVRMQQLDE